MYDHTFIVRSPWRQALPVVFKIWRMSEAPICKISSGSSSGKSDDCRGFGSGLSLWMFSVGGSRRQHTVINLTQLETYRCLESPRPLRTPICQLNLLPPLLYSLLYHDVKVGKRFAQRVRLGRDAFHVSAADSPIDYLRIPDYAVRLWLLIGKGIFGMTVLTHCIHQHSRTIIFDVTNESNELEKPAQLCRGIKSHLSHRSCALPQRGRRCRTVEEDTAWWRDHQKVQRVQSLAEERRAGSIGEPW